MCCGLLAVLLLDFWNGSREREKDHVVTVKEFQIGKCIFLFKMTPSNKNIHELSTFVLHLYVPRSCQKFQGDHLSLRLTNIPLSLTAKANPCISYS